MLAVLFIDAFIIAHTIKVAGFDKSSPPAHIELAPTATAAAYPTDDTGLRTKANAGVRSRRFPQRANISDDHPGPVCC